MTRFLTGLLVAALLSVSGCATQKRGPSASSTTPPATLPPGYVKTYVVFGKRYYVLGSPSGYDEKGMASWYGPNFHGRKTANGETYNMHGITAAHKSLPLGTWVRVTNLSNQRTLDMRINDRGPFVDDRVIDLSMGAAKTLGVVGPGTAPVRVVALGAQPTRSPGEQAAHANHPPDAAEPVTTATIERPAIIDSRPAPPLPPVAATPAPAPAPVASQPVAQVDNSATSNPSGFIQVASFGESVNARRMATQLEQSGFNNVIIQALTVNSRLLHRVRLGPLVSAEQQQTLLDKLSSMGLRGARVVTQ